jgi:preprotein translocase subunit Sec61beta
VIRVAAAWQLLRGGLFCFFEEEEEEKVKKFRE